MIKRSIPLTILFLFLGLGTITAQSFQRSEFGANLSSIAELNDLCPEENSGQGFNPSEKVTPAVAKKIVADIMNRIGISRVYNVRECKAVAGQNARAKLYFNQQGQPTKWIVYNSEFLEQFNLSTETNWAATFILAHEIGHHINDHGYIRDESTPELEMEADFYAGMALARMGAKLEDILKTPRSTKKLVTGKYDTHPGKLARMQQAYHGWFEFINQDTERLKAAAPEIKAYVQERNILMAQIGKKEEPQKPVIKKEEAVVEKPISKPTEEKEQPVADKTEQKPNVVKKDEKEDAALAEKEDKSRAERKGASDVLRKYFAALGGITKVNDIKSLTYSEKTTRSDYPGGRLLYDYDHQSSSLLIIYNRTQGYDSEIYKISNDSIYHKFGKNSRWKIGAPPPDNKDEKRFRKIINTSTGDFIEDFNLLASPKLISLKDTINFKGEMCYKLEVKETLESRDINKRGTGFQVFLKQNRYYRESDGLLHATENIRTSQYFKNKKQEYEDKEVTLTLHKEYREVEGIKFPHEYEIVTTYFQGPTLADELTINKEVSSIVLNPKSAN